MKAVIFDGVSLSLKEVPMPDPLPNETLIRINKAGICNTDLEITRGYMKGFNGILGHEFIGTIANTSLSTLSNKRVTAEINCGCGHCPLCKSGDERHCATRTVIGIAGRNGAFAEYISVPTCNIHQIPDSISDNNALFIEPLAAAIEILEQVQITSNQRVLIIGDGKLAQLIAHVTGAIGCNLYVAGKHPEKLAYLHNLPLSTILTTKLDQSGMFDIVIEASGAPDGFSAAVSKVRPRGTIVLKSTYAQPLTFNPATLVINEITLIGSRCGRFGPAIKFLTEKKPDFSYLIEQHYPLNDAIAAFEHAGKKGARKIILDM
ncbi:MAG TPA: alcohol dehydrogenase catalytic domain-containing protein [Chitinispirillaceae bacterium]|nr:alcohol dehydrogenase catalytic domain-containing protein [Chitinispirillaceae bacterium]